MKSKFKFFLSLLAFAMLVSHFSFAQSQLPTAQLSDDMSIILDTDNAVSVIYEADVSQYAYNMQDQQKANSFIEQFERPYVNCEVNLQSHKMTITLEMNTETNNWTVSQWNEYLKSN